MAIWTQTNRRIQNVWYKMGNGFFKIGKVWYKTLDGTLQLIYQSIRLVANQFIIWEDWQSAGWHEGYSFNYYTQDVKQSINTIRISGWVNQSVPMSVKGAVVTIYVGCKYADGTVLPQQQRFQFTAYQQGQNYFNYTYVLPNSKEKWVTEVNLQYTVNTFQAGLRVYAMDYWQQ